MDDWTVLSLDETLRAIVKRFVTEAKDGQSELYVVLFYGKSYSDARAKVSLDALAEILSEGLKGYVS